MRTLPACITLSCVARFAACGALFAAEAGQPELVLREGDKVALCGDSITSNGIYPQFIEMYQLLCRPKPAVTLLNFGRWGEVASSFPPIMDRDVLPAKPTVATICYGMNNCRSARVMSEANAKAWAASIKVVTDKFLAGGARVIVLASPGCVDSTHFTLSQNAPPIPAATVSTQRNLSMLRDAARELAAKEGFVFADMHTPMVEVMEKAKAKYGDEFAFAGGKGDGVHPGQAGHLVMAWVYLKSLGYDGEIGTLTLDLDRKTASASDGHKIVSFEGGVAEVESARYPFCFPEDAKSAKNGPNGNSMRSVLEFFPFNDDLNRLTLVVRGAKAKKLRIRWGGASREFETARLERGINLAAEFLDNPFCEPFAKKLEALRERDRCRGWLKQEHYKNDASIPRRLEVALKALAHAPVTHAIEVKELP